ncbi:hypothetical protein ACFE04_029229 [Oxalis oulophora]
MEEISGTITTHCYSTKIERKFIEKNRRNQMKILYSNLYSLIPNQESKETLSLPDQIDEAVNYIKSLETKINRLKDKKDKLNCNKTTGRKRLIRDFSNEYYYDASVASINHNKSLEFEIHEIGSSLHLAWLGEQGSEFVFYEVIRILYDEGLEVDNGNFSNVGINSVFYMVQAKPIRETGMGSAASRVAQRLNCFRSDPQDYLPELLDFQFTVPEMLDF